MSEEASLPLLSLPDLALIFRDSSLRETPEQFLCQLMRGLLLSRPEVPRGECMMHGTPSKGEIEEIPWLDWGQVGMGT